MEIFNKQLVSVAGNDIVVMAPLRRMTAEEALIHAAWLVTLAEAVAVVSGDKLSFTFAEALAKVQDS
jgi:hypothetical protein